MAYIIRDRREFLMASGVAALAGATACAEDASTNPSGDRRRQGPPANDGVETAVATICCDGFDDKNFEPSFEAIPQLGVRNVEFNCWYARNVVPSGLDSIAERCAKAGLRPISIQASAFSAGDSHAVTREVSRLMWLLEGCQRLGCRILKCTGSKRETAGGLEGLITVLKEVAPVAQEKGLLLTLENHFKNVIEFPEDYDEIFTKITSPSVGMCFDMGHFLASGVDMEALIERFSKKIYHIDVKDCARVGAATFVRFGQGKVEITKLLENCVTRGYQGYLVLELSLQDPSTMLNDLRAGLKLTQPFETQPAGPRTRQP